MKQRLLSYLLASFIAVFGLQTQSFAQLIPCSECGDPNSPNFLLLLEPVNVINNGSGMTTSAQLRVFFENQSSMSLDLTTISFALVYNGTNLSSLTGITSDAFPGTWVQNTQFSPPAVFVVDQDGPMDPPKTMGNHTYDRLYEYSHTGSGAPHPPQTIASAARVEIMTITMTFDGTQSFSGNTGDPNYLLQTSNMAMVPGECNRPCPNVNNQWGFENSQGNPMLVNCFRTTNSPFPIELLSFTGEAFPGYNELYWETATEINSEWHIIERSADPNNEEWIEVGRVAAAGESLEPINYSLRDNNPLELSYYRLKAVDLDGSFDYSDIVVLRWELLDDGTFSVYPNPTFSTVIIETGLTSKSDVMVEVVDALGRVLSSKIYADFSGFFREEINLGHYAPGMYFIRLDNGVKTLEAKVVKQ